MPIRTYTNLDLKNIVVTHVRNYDSYDNTPPNFSNYNFGATLSYSNSNPSVSNSAGDRQIAGNINFSQFPSIPVSAKIVSIRFQASYNLSASASCDSLDPFGASIVSRFNNDGVSINLGSAIFPYIVDTGMTSSVSENHSGVIDNIIDYTLIPPGYITYAQLVSLYTNLSVELIGAINAGVGASATSFSVSLSDWRMYVQYDLENYSWYIKPTTIITNGQDIDVIDDANDDIIVIDNTDTAAIASAIRKGYILYGSGDDFPSGPVYYWWISPYEYLFFIYSPISPGEDWSIFGASPPTCTNCLTMSLGSNDVLVADVSGVYTLNANKRNDTLYVRDGSVIVEIDVMKPPPFVKIGYVP